MILYKYFFMTVRIIYLLALRIKKIVIDICTLFLIIFIIFNYTKIYF